MIDRKQELINIVTKTGTDNFAKTSQLIDELVFIENKLRELRELPFLNVHPDKPALQKATPAAKQYKEMMQQYNNSLRLLFRLTGDLGGEVEEESPLRQWAKSRNE